MLKELSLVFHHLGLHFLFSSLVPALVSVPPCEGAASLSALDGKKTQVNPVVVVDKAEEADGWAERRHECITFW